jgi:hypothetical protein
MSLRKFSRVTPLSAFWVELAVSRATGNTIEKSDPAWPHDEIVQIGQNRRGITERGKAIYQRALMERAKQPRPVSKNLDARVAAAASIEKRREKAKAKRRAAEAATVGTAA